MATPKKKPNPPQAGDAQSGDAQAEPKPQSKAREMAPAGKPCQIVLKQPMKIGRRDFPAGTVIAEMRLSPGVTVNYVVDACRNSQAREKPEE